MNGMGADVSTIASITGASADQINTVLNPPVKGQCSRRKNWVCSMAQRRVLQYNYQLQLQMVQAPGRSTPSNDQIQCQFTTTESNGRNARRNARRNESYDGRNAPYDGRNESYDG